MKLAPLVEGFRFNDVPVFCESIFLHDLRVLAGDSSAVNQVSCFELRRKVEICVK